MLQVDSATTYEISMRTIGSGNVRRLKNSLYSKANTANRFAVIENISKDNLKKFLRQVKMAKNAVICCQ